MHAANGILFNHESPLRGETFVTRKITRVVAKIALGLQDKLYIGNLNARWDWGHTRDYVEAMWLILQQDEPEDFVIATGMTTSVRDFIDLAFAEVGIHLRYEVEGMDEKGVIDSIDEQKYNTMTSEYGINFELSALSLSAAKTGFQLAQGQVVLEIDPRYFRPAEVDLLVGDATRAREKLGWEPKYDLQALFGGYDPEGYGDFSEGTIYLKTDRDR